MKDYYLLQHKTAFLNPYGSIVQVLDGDPDKLLVGIKNVRSIPNTLIHKLEPAGFTLHTIDKKSQLAGRAVDTQLINPISGRYMSGSSSGTAINVFAGINDLGIGNDGGGSVLAPAISLNIISFISKRIEADRPQQLKPNTDNITAGNSIGFMVRDKKILYGFFAGSSEPLRRLYDHRGADRSGRLRRFAVRSFRRTHPHSSAGGGQGVCPGMQPGWCYGLVAASVSAGHRDTLDV